MEKRLAMTGNSAIAYAMKQINPDVCAAYPITPSTGVMEDFSKYVADGLVDTNLVAVESEHSAMSACIGAAAAGGRVMTATSANGMALMWELLYIASGMRLPIVLAIVNRALSAPLNIHGDHSDTMGARDSGWIQIYSENANEAYDNLIQAVRIAEHPDVMLPVMVCCDGFIISHAVETIITREDEEVQEFVGKYTPEYSLLNVDRPSTFGMLDIQNYYIEHKRQQKEAMEKALSVIVEVGKEFGRRFGRTYSLFEEYYMEDAEVAIVVMSSAAGTTLEVIKGLRREGKRIGMVKPRVFRPFPALEISRALENVDVITVLDRSDSFGAMGGPLFIEICSALYQYSRKRPLVMGKTFGLGGRDYDVDDVKGVIDELFKVHHTGRIEKIHDYITIRE